MRHRLIISLGVAVGLVVFYEAVFRYVTASCGEVNMKVQPPRVYYSDDLVAPFAWRSALFGFRTRLPFGKVRLSQASGVYVDGGRFYFRMPDGSWKDLTDAMIDYQKAKQ